MWQQQGPSWLGIITQTVAGWRARRYLCPTRLSQGFLLSRRPGAEGRLLNPDWQASRDKHCGDKVLAKLQPKPSRLSPSAHQVPTAARETLGCPPTILVMKDVSSPYSSQLLSWKKCQVRFCHASAQAHSMGTAWQDPQC